MGGCPPRLTSDGVPVTLVFRQPLAEFRRVVPADVGPSDLFLSPHKASIFFGPRGQGCRQGGMDEG